MKVQGSWSSRKNKKKPFDLGWKMMKVDMVLEDVSVGENGAKMHVV